MFVEYGDAPAGGAQNLPGRLIQRITDGDMRFSVLPLLTVLKRLNFLGVSVTFKEANLCTLYLVNRLGGFGQLHSALCRLWQQLASIALKCSPVCRCSSARAGSSLTAADHVDARRADEEKKA